MFERYTEKARRVIFFARYEAGNYGSWVIDTQHLLLGLLREEKQVCLHWIPKAQPDTIRMAIEGWAKRRAPIVGVDLPLSDASKRVLVHAMEEADRLNHKPIGTQHLLLGLLQEDCPASQLLVKLGADISILRTKLEKEPEPATAPALDAAFLSARIHGTRSRLLHKHNWHWHRTAWKPQDVAVHRTTGKVSFDVSLAEDSANFELVKGGWKKDCCAICSLELFEAEDNHGTGYTNGRQWVCLDCYDKYWDQANFISGSFEDLT